MESVSQGFSSFERGIGRLLFFISIMLVVVRDFAKGHKPFSSFVEQPFFLLSFLQGGKKNHGFFRALPPRFFFSVRSFLLE